MKRIYLVTGTIILLLLIVGVLLVWQKTIKAPEITPIPMPKPVPVAPVPTGWKTYENKEFGFAFDYPWDWKVEEFRTTKGERAPYSFYEIRLWAPDQFDDEKRLDSKYLNDHFADPRILIYADNENKGEEIEKQLEKNIDAYQKNGETVKMVDLPKGIKAHIVEKSTHEELLIIAFNKIMITFNSGLGVPLRMDIVRTFRFSDSLTP